MNRSAVRGSLQLLLFPALSGFLLWTAFPKANLGFIAWVALAPLIFYLTRVSRIRWAFLGGWLAGFIQFLGLLYWIPQVLSHYGGLPALGSWGLFAALAAFLGCYPAAVCALTRFCMNRGGDRFLFLFPPAWIALEYLRGVFPLGGFPWLMIGYSQTDFPALIQFADVAGVYGVSILLAWVNVALSWTVAGIESGWRRFVPLMTGAAATAAVLAYGFFALDHWDLLQPQHRAALLQGNLSIDEHEDDLLRKYGVGYVEMAEQLAGKNVDLLVLPESPSPVFYQHDAGYRELMKSLARRFPMGMVFNNVSFREIAGAPAYFNSAFFLDRNGLELGIYEKIHLVPFGEYVPLKEIFFFSETISKDVGDFHAGTDRVTISMGGHLINVIICFEAVFPDLSREFVRRGSELIVNLTNDAWYGDTSAPYQHLAMARWRAIESRRYLLRAANSGISAVIAPSGRVTVHTGLLQKDIAIGGFSFLNGSTFYVRHGALLPILCVIILFSGLLWSFARGRRAA